MRSVLTERCFEYASEMITGKTNTQITEKMGITTKSGLSLLHDVRLAFDLRIRDFEQVVCAVRHIGLSDILISRGVGFSPVAPVEYFAWKENRNDRREARRERNRLRSGKNYKEGKEREQNIIDCTYQPHLNVTRFMSLPLDYFLDDPRAERANRIGRVRG